MTKPETFIGRRSRNTLLQVTIAIIAAMGSALAFYTTSQGIGTEVDSATYVMAARNLLAGNGLSLQIAGSARQVPLTSFPPLLPLALASIGYTGIDPLVAARWLNIALFGADIFLVALFVSRRTESDMAAIFSALLTATTVDVLLNHCMLISEPLFLFCALAGFILMARYIERPTLPLLFGFSAAFAAAGAARYIGITLLPIGAAAIVLGPWPYRLRRLHLTLYAGTFLFPLLIWVARNMILVHTLTNHSAAFHPLAFNRFVFSYLSFSTWLLPSAVPRFLRVIAVAAAAALLFRPVWYRSRADQRSPSKSRLDGLLIAFLCSYILGFVITQTFFDAQIWISGRHLLLVYVIGSIVVISQGRELFNSAGPYLRVACICLCIAMLGAGALRTAKNVRSVHDEGLGLTSRRWQTSELIMKTKELDDRVPIITNSKAIVYLLTGKLAYPIPSPINAQTERLAPEYASEMAWINDKVQHGGGVIVYFTALKPDQATIPEENDLETQVGLRRFAATRDGYLLAKL